MKTIKDMSKENSKEIVETLEGFVGSVETKLKFSTLCLTNEKVTLNLRAYHNTLEFSLNCHSEDTLDYRDPLLQKLITIAKNADMKYVVLDYPNSLSNLEWAKNSGFENIVSEDSTSINTQFGEVHRMKVQVY